jgi:TolA-binding protein
MQQFRPRAALLCLFVFALCAARATAQSPGPPPSSDDASPAPAAAAATEGGGVSGNLFVPEEVRRQLREQREQLEEMRAALKEQARLIEELRGRMERAERATAPAGATPAVIKDAAFAHATPAESPGASASSGARRGGAAGQEGKPLDERVAGVEAQAKKTGEALSRQLGSMTFGGDMRFRYESLYGQQNAAATAGNPDALGNPLNSRQRLRLRARFGVRGQVGKEFEWGLRLATGSFADVHSTNQTLTDFFSRKNFALDQAFIAYKPSRLPGFRVQAGKFETPWLRTEMTWDNDNTIEGLSESYERKSEKSRLKELAFVAWQSPLLERNAAFVLNSDGTVNLGESARGGRDLALYGAQLRARLAPTEHLSLTLSAADLYFSGTQFINPAQFFGPNIQLPVSVNIPASGTTPARTVTAQVSVPRDMLVGGNSNLGFSSATTNAVNRDGRLSSGYNLLDLIARVELSRSKRWPLMLLLNFVTNTQAHDVVSAGPGGADVLQRNDEDRGYWAEFQVRRLVNRTKDESPETPKRGDLLFNYTFLRIEKDAVLSPFNFSDLSIFSDVRGHRLSAAYTADPRVVLSLTGIFAQRPNGLAGPFGATPPGSLNRTLTRIQLDTILRF